MKYFTAVRCLLRDQRLFLRKVWIRLRTDGTCFRLIRKNYNIWNRMALRQWLLYHQHEIVFTKCYWMGVRAKKNPFDAWIYQEIIYETKPDIIVEIGSAEGGSTIYFANLLDILGKGKVISIDIDRANYKAKHPRIIEITGDSSAPETVAKASEFCRGKSVLVVHDGGHSCTQVQKDLLAYSNLVSVGSYFIIEDGIIDLFKPGDGIGSWEPGPLIAIEEFLKNNSDFVVDKERERYILTYNPKGFLKKIK